MQSGLQTFINTAGGALSLARDYVGLQLAMQKVIRVSMNNIESTFLQTI